MHRSRSSLIASVLRTFLMAAVACSSFRSANANPPESAPNELPRVLLIGDSISMGYTQPVIELMKGKAEVHRVRGNAGHTAMGLAGLPKWLDERHGKWDVIHFNWGLWQWGLWQYCSARDAVRQYFGNGDDIRREGCAVRMAVAVGDGTWSCGALPPRSVKRLATPDGTAAESSRLVFRRSLVLAFQFRQVGQQLVLAGRAAKVKADHLVGSLGRLAARPQADQQTGDDRAVGLDLDAILLVSTDADSPAGA